MPCIFLQWSESHRDLQSDSCIPASSGRVTLCDYGTLISQLYFVLHIDTCWEPTVCRKIFDKETITPKYTNMCSYLYMNTQGATPCIELDQEKFFLGKLLGFQRFLLDFEEKREILSHESKLRKCKLLQLLKNTSCKLVS